jgi:hypothetical protein
MCRRHQSSTFLAVRSIIARRSPRLEPRRWATTVTQRVSAGARLMEMVFAATLAPIPQVPFSKEVRKVVREAG